MKEQSGNVQQISACFIEPMLCLAVERLPEGTAWQYEVKLDGYRAIGVRMTELPMSPPKLLKAVLSK